MGFLGDTWPFFRPNFVNMETYRNQQQAQQVGQHTREYGDGRLFGCSSEVAVAQLQQVVTFRSVSCRPKAAQGPYAAVPWLSATRVSKHAVLEW